MQNARFTLVIGSGKPRDFWPQDGRLTIGNSKSALVRVNDSMLEDVHAEIVGDEARGFQLNVMGINSLSVNGRDVRSATLAVNDKIEFSNGSLQLVADPARKGSAKAAAGPRAKIDWAAQLKRFKGGTGMIVLVIWAVMVVCLIAALNHTSTEKYEADLADYHKFVVDKLDSAECRPSWRVAPDAKSRFRELVGQGMLAERRRAAAVAFANYSEALAITFDFRCVPVRYARSRRDAVKTILPK